MKPDLLEMTLDFTSFRVTAFPSIDKVVFISKWSGQTESYSGQQFIEILDRVAEYKRSNPEEKELLEERDRLKRKLEKLQKRK